MFTCSICHKKTNFEIIHKEHTQKIPNPLSGHSKTFTCYVLSRTPKPANLHYDSNWCYECHLKTQKAAQAFFSQFSNLTTKIPSFCSIQGCFQPIYIKNDSIPLLNEYAASEDIKNYLFDLRITPYLRRKFSKKAPTDLIASTEKKYSICVVYRYLKGEAPTTGELVINNVLEIAKNTIISFKFNPETDFYHPDVVTQ